jgi:hypothetical protein
MGANEMFATNWAQLFLIIAATCALPSLVVGYVSVLRPALARGKGRQMGSLSAGWGGNYPTLSPKAGDKGGAPQ